MPSVEHACRAVEAARPHKLPRNFQEMSVPAPALWRLIGGRRGPSGLSSLVLLLSPTLSSCPWLALSPTQPGRLHTAHHNCQSSPITVQEASGKVPGRGRGAGRAGAWERGLGALSALLSPVLWPSSPPQPMAIWNTCIQHTNQLRLYLEASGSPPRGPDLASWEACEGHTCPRDAWYWWGRGGAEHTCMVHIGQERH